MSSDTGFERSKPSFPPMIFILSGGVGASGEQLVNTVLAQFPDNTINVQTIGNLRQTHQITHALELAKKANGLVIYTFVNSELRRHLVSEANEKGIPSIDLMGPLIDWLTNALGQEPLQEPGKYRQLHREYYDRVSAIDFTLSHDDGKNPEGWPQAEVVLAGVSRSGKTPLSVYLAVLGWKVANYPLVPQLPIPQMLFDLDPNHVIGLTIEPEQLLVFRRQRQVRLGIKESSSYTDLESIKEEMQQARKIFRRANFRTVNMTDKTIEQGADEIIRLLAGQDGSSPF